MVIICKYRLKKKGTIYFIVLNRGETIPCPICGKHLSYLEDRERTLRWPSGKKKILIIRRLQCDGCGKIHHELPDIIIPYKRHCAVTIERIITGGAVDSCEESTIHRIRRWWAAVYTYFHGILTAQKEKFGVCFGEPIQPKAAVRAAANTHQYPLTRSAYA